MAAADQIIRARVPKKVKDEANVALKAMGITMSDAMRMLAVKIAHERRLPFAPYEPNAKTIAAMKELNAGKGKRAKSIADLLGDDA